MGFFIQWIAVYCITQCMNEISNGAAHGELNGTYGMGLAALFIVPDAIATSCVFALAERRKWGWWAILTLFPTPIILGMLLVFVMTVIGGVTVDNWYTACAASSGLFWFSSFFRIATSGDSPPPRPDEHPAAVAWQPEAEQVAAEATPEYAATQEAATPQLQPDQAETPSEDEAATVAVGG